MTKDIQRSIERLQERIEESPDISHADRGVLKDFDREIRLRAQSYSDQRHEKFLMRLVKLAEEVGGLGDALEEKAAAEDLVAWIHDNYENPETNRDYRIALRMFGEHATEGSEKPSSIEWIPSTYPSTYDPAPDPAEMLRWEDDIKPMLDAAKNFRDGALVALAWDAGPRPGELYDLRIGDITDHKYGKQITVQGKRGQRSPVIIPSVPYVQQWLQVHPGGNETDYLWTRLNRNERVSKKMVQKALREVAGRAGVEKPVTPTNFRKSSASYLASEGVPQAHLEDHHGWTRGSKVAARYISVFGDAAEQEIARVHGVDIDEADQGEPVGPVTCHRCGRETPRHEEACVWCSAALSHEAAERAREQNSEVRQGIAREDGAVAEAAAELGDLLEEYPQLRAALSDD